MECIETHGPEDKKAQNVLYRKIKQNTIDPTAKSSTAEKVRALEITLKELAEDRFSIVSQIEKAGAKMTGSRSARIQERIVELQSSIDAPDVHESTKARYEKQLEQLLESTRTPDTSSPVASGELTDTYATNKGSWKKVVKDDIEIYNQGNAVIQKLKDRKWVAMKKGSDRTLTPYGDNFLSMRDAIQALNEDKTSSEFYPAKEAKEKKPLQLELLEGMSVKKYAEMVVNSIPELKGDPEAIGVASEAIVEATRNFDPEKAKAAGSRFTTFAYDSARGKALTYYKRRSEIQSMEVSSNTVGEDEEGSQTESKVENVSKRQIEFAPKENKTQGPTEKEMKGPAAPIKRVEATLAEKKALMDKINEKKNRDKKVVGVEITAKESVKAPDTEEPKSTTKVKETTEEQDKEFALVQAQKVKEDDIRAAADAEANKAKTSKLKAIVESKKKSGVVTAAKVKPEKDLGNTDSTGKKISTKLPEGAKTEEVQLRNGHTIQEIVSYVGKMFHGTKIRWEGAFKTSKLTFLTDNREQSKTYKSSEGQIKEVQVNLQKPYVVDWEGREWHNGPNGIGSAAQVASRIAKGSAYDGILFLNIVDPGSKESSTAGYKRSPSNQIVILKESAIQDIVSKDEAPTIIIRRPKSRFVSEEVQKEQTVEAKETYEILKRTKWNKPEALKIASHIKDTNLRQKVTAQINAVQQNTIGGVLQQTLANSVPGSKTHKLAGFLSSLLTNPSKRAIKVVVDPSLTDAYFDPNTGVVHLTDTTTDLIGLHEVQHAITSREMDMNPELKAKVRAVMDVVKASIVNDPTVKISKADIKRLESIKGTSAAFKKEFGSESFEGDSGILYALLNEKEFLAQAFNDSRVQEIFMNTEAPKGSGFKNMFDYIVQLFLDIFGQAKIKNNVMREVLQLTAELSKVDLRYGKVSEIVGIDGMFAGALSETANINKMQNAIDRVSRGEGAESVRKSTGWYNDIDGEWKYEISDKDSSFLYSLKDLDVYDKFSFSDKGKYKLGDIFEHNKLFEAYPELLDINVILADRVGLNEKTRGSFNPNTKTITLKVSAGEAQLRKTLLHEMQHWVQQYENFAVGGTVETIRLTEVLDHMEDLYTLEKSNAKDKGDVEMYETLTDNLRVLEEVRENKTELNKIYDKLASKTTSMEDRIDTKKKMGSLFTDTKALTQVMYDVYHLIAGEAEARNVAERSDLSAKERLKSSPDDTNDISPEYAIVHKLDSQVEALDMSDEAVVEKTWDQRADIMMKNDVNSTKLGVVKEFFSKKVYPSFKDKVVSTTERLRELAPGIMTHVRRFEFEINKYNARYHEEAKEYVDKYKKMSKRDQKILDQTLRNNYPDDVEKRWEILKKYSMTKAYEKAVAVLEDIQKRKLKVSLGKYQEIPDYWPRKVKDLTALMQTMEGDPNYGVIEAELRKAGLNKADREIAIQNMIHTGRYPALALLKPGSDKARTIKRVSSEWAHHYENSVDSLINHIYESNEAIEARNMFGDVARGKLVQDRDDLYKKLETLKGEKEREAVVGKITNIEASLSNYEENWKEGISTLLEKDGHKLSATAQDEIISLIRARLLQKGMSGVAAFLRNVSLMTVLGGPISAITQLTDLVTSVHANGLANTGGSLFGNRVITTKDLDLSHSMRDFQTEGSAKWLDRVLTASGLKMMDVFGKNVFMNSAILKAKDQSLKEFTKQWGDQLGLSTEATWEELKSGKKTDLTRFFAFNALSEWQPVSMSEMPKGYLEAENGRIFYALKSFNIKSINNLRREIWYKTREAKSPAERRVAMAQGAKLVVLMILAGASTDELKDLIMGRDVEFSDNVANNLLKIGFMNTYMLEQGDKRGMVKTMLGDTLLPPTRVADDVYTDLRNLLDLDPDTETTVKFLRSVPWGGLIYAHGTEAAQKTNASQLKKRISEKVKGGAGMSDIRSDMVKYNRMAREMGETVMTYKSIQAMKKRNEKKK